MCLNIGEQIVSDYLKCIEKCSVVDTGVALGRNGGELDVIGFLDRKVYFCEVAVHVNGLRYTNNGGTKENIKKKFRAIQSFADEKYAKSKYNHIFQFWSPVVKNGVVDDLLEVAKDLKREGINLKLVINENFRDSLIKIKEFTSDKKSELKSPVLRLFQIETHIHI